MELNQGDIIIYSLNDFKINNLILLVHEKKEGTLLGKDNKIKSISITTEFNVKVSRFDQGKESVSWFIP